MIDAEIPGLTDAAVRLAAAALAVRTHHLPAEGQIHVPPSPPPTAETLRRVRGTQERIRETARWHLEATQPALIRAIADVDRIATLLIAFTATRASERHHVSHMLTSIADSVETMRQQADQAASHLARQREEMRQLGAEMARHLHQLTLITGADAGLGNLLEAALAESDRDIIGSIYAAATRGVAEGSATIIVAPLTAILVPEYGRETPLMGSALLARGEADETDEIGHLHAILDGKIAALRQPATMPASAALVHGLLSGIGLLNSALDSALDAARGFTSALEGNAQHLRALRHAVESGRSEAGLISGDAATLRGSGERIRRSQIALGGQLVRSMDPLGETIMVAARMLPG